MSELIVKDNALIQASYTLDTVEQRLILLAIAEARQTGYGITENSLLEVHASSYINQFNVERHTAYQALKDACKDLFARQFSYQEKRERGRINITSRWVSQIGYMDDTATVEIIFAPAVVPLITRLEEQFTQYDIEQISGLSSAYAVRMYELLICWRSTGKTPIIELEEFRKRIGVLDTEYTRTDNLKMRVIELALKQINEHTDVFVEYEQHKKGRSITGFTFKFRYKKTVTQHKQRLIERDPNTADMFTKYTDAQLGRAVHSKKFIADYNGLVSAQNPANQSSSAWVKYMVEWMKREPNRFTKRAIQEYLDDVQEKRF